MIVNGSSRPNQKQHKFVGIFYKIKYKIKEDKRNLK